MEKFIKMLLLLFACVQSQVLAQSTQENVHVISNNDWSKVISAIIQVESSGKSDARSGLSVGAMQITPILVLECNNILKSRRIKKRYKLSDRLSVKKSKEMFLLFQQKYNPKNNVEWAIRSWNGGINFKVKRTQRYFEKVMALIKKN